ncbi:MAG: glycosyltransferase family 4 protein [Bacteroidota bacterium]
MKKAIVFGSYLPSLINFRKNLLIDLIDLNYEVVALAPGEDKEVEKQLSEIKVKFIKVPLARTGFNPWRDMKCYNFLKKLFKRIKPDVLITYTIKPNIYGTWAATSISSCKTIAWITGLGYIGMEKKKCAQKFIRAIILTLYRRAFRRLNFIAFQNPDDERFFDHYRLLNQNTNRTITSGSGIDLDLFYKVPPVLNPVTFLLVARLIAAKGVKIYIDAAVRIKKKYPTAQFRLIGMLDKGNPDAIKENEIRQLHDAGVIFYCGFQKDIRTELARSSVFVLPSYYREGTPRTILEALAMGKPVITTDNPGCRETTVDSLNGFLIPVKNTDKLVEALEKFITNPELIKKMGTESYGLAVRKYDVHKVNSHLFKFANIT